MQAFVEQFPDKPRERGGIRLFGEKTNICAARRIREANSLSELNHHAAAVADPDDLVVVIHSIGVAGALV